MDQSRLEELRKLLNNQHSDAKQNLTEGLYPKNFNAFDFKNLKLEDASSKTLNSDDTAINKSSEVQARDYDKNPIVIKDYAFYDYMKYSTIATLIGCLFFISVVTVVNPIEPKNFRLLPFALVMFFIRRKQQKGVYFVFNDSDIKYYKEDKAYKSLKLEQIGAVAISFDPRWDRQQRISIPEMLFLSLWPLGAYVMRGMHAMIALISMIAISLFGASILMHLKNGSFRCLGVYDRLVIYGETGDLRIINVLIYSEKEYLELREYFMRKTHIDLDTVPRTLSVFSKKVKFRKFKF
ncbi:hypothetical protein [uncultured Campylobacter sp.]|uniref:hypothetical protein n=1 Tax=uncultured Campylobacter sp. TaxID=218934 RepID=UPI00260448C8|nr:hypothetical protein [uncultured Campylobacter sp.]